MHLTTTKKQQQSLKIIFIIYNSIQKMEIWCNQLCICRNNFKLYLQGLSVFFQKSWGLNGSDIKAVYLRIVLLEKKNGAQYAYNKSNFVVLRLHFSASTKTFRVLTLVFHARQSTQLLRLTLVEYNTEATASEQVI